MSVEFDLLLNPLLVAPEAWKLGSRPSGRGRGDNMWLLVFLPGYFPVNP